MSKSLVALIAGAFVVGSGALMAQAPVENAQKVPQTSPETTAKFKAEHDAAEKAEAKMTPEQKAAAEQNKQKELSTMVQKTQNPQGRAAPKSDPNALPDSGAKQPMATKVTAVQPGLMEIAGPRVQDALAAGITKITATTAKIEVHSPYGNINFRWPQNVAPMAFSVEASSQKKGVATINAPGFNDANRADYKAAFEAVVPIAISKAQAQKERKTTGG